MHGTAQHYMDDDPLMWPRYHGRLTGARHARNTPMTHLSRSISWHTTRDSYPVKLMLRCDAIESKFCCSRSDCEQWTHPIGLYLQNFFVFDIVQHQRHVRRPNVIGNVSATCRLMSNSHLQRRRNSTVGWRQSPAVASRRRREGVNWP